MAAAVVVATSAPIAPPRWRSARRSPPARSGPPTSATSPKGIIFVERGATLTIEPGTKIMGEKVSLATLVVKPGAKINAKGTASKPIVFTSQGEAGDRAAGDWGGVILLGEAPVNVEGGEANVEGITGEGTEYGGDKPADNERCPRVRTHRVQRDPPRRTTRSTASPSPAWAPGRPSIT